MVIGYAVSLTFLVIVMHLWWSSVFKGLRVAQNRSFMVIVICVDSEVVVRSLSGGDVVRVEIDPKDSESSCDG
jgi:hypothetical protein